MTKEVHSFKASGDHAVYLMEGTLAHSYRVHNIESDYKIYSIEIRESDGCSKWTVTLHPEDFNQAWSLYKKIEEVI